MSQNISTNHSVTGYLVVKAKRNNYIAGRIMELTSTRFVKSKPSLTADEAAVKVTVTLPDSAFNEPAYAAVIEVAERDVIRPEVTVEAGEQ